MCLRNIRVDRNYLKIYTSYLLGIVEYSSCFYIKIAEILPKATLQQTLQHI